MGNTMPAGIVLPSDTIVKNICVISSPLRTYEDISINDLLECLSITLKYIIKNKRNKEENTTFATTRKGYIYLLQRVGIEVPGISIYVLVTDELKRGLSAPCSGRAFMKRHLI